MSTKAGIRDARAEDLKGQIELLGISGVESVLVADRYFIDGELSLERFGHLAEQLLCDPVIEDVRCLAVVDDVASPQRGEWTVDVVLRPGVTDSTAESLLVGADSAGMSQIDRAATGRRYRLRGAISETDVHRVARSLLANAVIQDYYVNATGPPPFPVGQAGTSVQRADVIPIRRLDSSGMEAISNDRRLALDKAEMMAIQAHFRDEGRDPTDLELEMLAQTWSEHCVHKTFKARISYTGPSPGTTKQQATTVIDSILDTHLRAATDTIDRPWVRSAFVDDAGIVALDDDYDLAFKVETHNHPSALEPFGGANTGVGGVVRDIMGVSARPIANTDILFFGPQDVPFDRIPDGVLHPRRIAEGVVAGIEDYGNKMGIPTVSGAIFFHPGYTANPLVFCGCLGILPRGSHPTQPCVGDLVVVLGGRTGRDGLRGATFSSMETDHLTGEVSSGAVQIGHPIHEKQVMEAIVLARDAGLYNAITDCGAGGLSSSVGEMAETLGAQVHLDRVPLKYPGLAPWEIWLSEAQERMVIAVPQANLREVARICTDLDVEMTVIGEFTGDGRLHILYEGAVVGDMECEFLHNGIPRLELSAEWVPPATGDDSPPPLDDPSATLLEILSLPNIRSKEDVVRRYDHEVQGGTVVKPFVGKGRDGPADAAVIVPLESHRRETRRPTAGAALSIGTNPAYGDIDPYLMAWAAVDEAVRNVVAVGADPDRISILDNFSWGNPRLPDRLGSLIRCTQGCHDAAIAYQTPFISGKDSLNNEYTGEDGTKHTIPGTLVISALGVVPDSSASVTSDLKASGSLIFAVGVTGSELGGSALAEVAGIRGGSAPRPPANAIDGYRRLHRAIRAGIVASCHDASEGGWAVAAAEMAIGGRVGLDLDLGRIPRRDEVTDSTTAAFSESLGRLLVEVSREDADAFARIMDGYAFDCVGRVGSGQRLEIRGIDDAPFIAVDVADLAAAWRGHVGGGP